MTLEEALAIIDITLKPERLNDLQELVFRRSWDGKTYQEIAIEAGYDQDYVRLVGFQLWQSLSDAFGEKVTKKNFRSILRQHPAEAVELDGAGSHLLSTGVTVTPEWNPPVPHVNALASELRLEIPEGPVSLDSPFYIDRPPIEEQCYAEILKPGALIRLRAPSKMGKTSLKNRILAYAAAQGYHTIRLNFEQADEAILNNANQFLRWFCANVSRQLGLEPRLDDYWDEDFGSKVSCTIYFQGYILEQLNSPMVLALEEVNQIFEHAEIAQNFLPLLRSWYEEAKDVEIWQKLRLVVVHSTEIYVPLNLNQSPFNVGLPIRLPEFTLAQVQDLALRHGLAWADGEAGIERLAPLLEMVGGHPYRVRIALYHLGHQEMTLEQLLTEAPTLAGIYSHRLRYHWTTLQAYPELMAAMQQVVRATGQVKIAPIPAYKLESMGLIKLKGEGALSSCELYRLYFRTQLD